MKRVHTRKYTALWCCGAALLTAVLLGVTGIYRFLPSQGVALTADCADIEEPRAVKWFYDPVLPCTRLGPYVLVDGERAMMLCRTDFSLAEGWQSGAWCRVETWDGTGMYAGVYSHSQGETRVTYLFGRVDDPAVRRLELERVAADQVESPRTQTQAVMSEAVFEQDGQRYFLLKLEEVSDWPWEWTRYRVNGWSDDGRLVQSAEAVVQSWSAME